MATSKNPTTPAALRSRKTCTSAVLRRFRLAASFLALILLAAPPLFSLPLPKDKTPLSPGFAAEIAAPEADVLQAVLEVVRDQTIHGTYQFEKEQTLTGANEADSSPYFTKWEGAGKVFYKIRTDVIAPRHFREAGDQGTIAVRFVVQSVAAQRTLLHIDAVYVEAARRIAHPSDGTVESSEYKAVQEHLQALQLQAQEAEEARSSRERAEAERQLWQRRRDDESARLAAAQSSVRELEQRAQALRHAVEARVKAPAGELKAAPFRSATTLQPLTAYTEVVILVLTPYWYGVEIPSGQRGWIRRDQLEPLP
ncbi:MAG: hypothetical protein LAN61_05215 [Acidobacteriia bacterium]|nr:hypothetical protein [Terriglobia bacterium]